MNSSARVAALVSDFPRLWHNPRTPDVERKRMIRLLLADVMIIRGIRSPYISASMEAPQRHCNCRGRLTAWELRTTPAEIVAEIDRLTGHHTDKKIVEILNNAERYPAAVSGSTVASSHGFAVNTKSNRAMIGYARKAC